MSFYKKAAPGQHGFVSELDKFLLEYNEQRQDATASIVHEIEKHKKIAYARDTDVEPDVYHLWDQF